MDLDFEGKRRLARKVYIREKKIRELNRKTFIKKRLVEERYLVTEGA